MYALIGADFAKKIPELFAGAKKNIDLVAYDWRWYANQPGHAVQKVNIALVQAAQRGVQVRAVLNDPGLVPLLQKVRIQARITKDRRTLHAKLILIDGTIAICGSHNITRNAFSHNVECSVVVEIEPGNERLQQFFSNLWGL